MIDTSKVIHAPVGGGRYTVTAPIVKEDYGLYLKIEGLELPSTYEVDFSNSEHNGTSVTMIGNADGVLIPRQFITTGKDVFAFLYHVGADFGRTVYKFRIPNKLRPDRTDEQPTPEEQSVIDQTISALNTAVDTAEEAAREASRKAAQIEELSANAETLAPGSQATASYQNGVLTIGVPRGDKGEKGDTGAPGPKGEQGVQGIQGIQGPKGEKGDTGETGATGPKGDKGDKGDTGAQGIQGPKGDKGDTGEQGPKGDTGATGPQGIQGERGLTGADGISPTVTITPITGGHRITITDADGEHSADIMDGTGNVDDVQINGTSIVEDGVANVPIASRLSPGVIKVDANAVNSGLYVNDGNGFLETFCAPKFLIKNGDNTHMPVVPSNQHESTFYGLAKASGDTTQSQSSNAVGNYTEDAKSKISEMLGGSVSVSGTTPTIIAKSGIRYVCGEVATLDITPSASGICDVVFTSGSTPTVVTLPSTVKFPDGAFTAEANTTYEINILDGVYGVVMAWT